MVPSYGKIATETYVLEPTEMESLEPTDAHTDKQTETLHYTVVDIGN